ncbi:S-adenosyl-L-methionine-dependent methyltransferase-like protein [Rutstroemia sp. NJR-2017a WRK4]|nr:S-adenosyl-L-methionine-dependent methyltransferase-like protein [Rutstroemia sp. NJR-2017a WRK4]
MLPSRKRSKPDPKVEQQCTTQPQAPSQASLQPAKSTPELRHTASKTSAQQNDDSSKKLQLNASWYRSWPRKSTASTQVAKETILADKPSNGDLTADLSRFDQRKSPQQGASRPPSMYLGKSKPASEITLGGTLEGAEDRSINNKKDQDEAQNTNRIEASPKAQSLKESDTPKEPTITSPNAEISERPSTSQGWLGWLSMPTQSSKDPLSTQEPMNSVQTAEPVQATAVPSAPSSNSGTAQTDESTQIPKQPLSATRPWFNLWPASQPIEHGEAPKDQPLPQVANDTEDPALKDAADASKSAGDAPKPTGDAPKPAGTAAPSKSTRQSGGSSWASAFWYSDTSKKDTSPPENENKVETGELAVFGQQSQTQPTPAETVSTPDNSPMQTDKKAKSVKKGKPKPLEIEDVSQKTLVARPDSPSKKSITSLSPPPPNLLLPSVQGTYHLMENPSILRQLTRLIIRGREKPLKHVSLSKEILTIKNAVAIGVHGLFPAPLLRKLIGQPSGTSIRFANHAAAAIRRWADDHGSPNCEIEKVALDGEGKIFERVDKLWKLLTNWTDRLRQADYIMVAAHSQGVPVALMLVAKLIEEGIVTSARIGVCAMAGVSLGPFASHQTGYQAALFNETITELFEFANYESAVAKRYEQALRRALKYGVRVTYCASIDDQLVSIESAIFSPAEHPYIYRAVFVDGRIHAPDFIAHLVGFALKLRNLGVSDHGLIRELSAPLAGSLYTGGGHSRLYDDDNVYDMAIEHSLATTSVPDVPLYMSQYSPPTNANPYVLPWIMRGVLEEEFVKTELHTEAVELLKQFDDWKPSTKVLQDVKYRLEAVRSKL